MGQKGSKNDPKSRKSKAVDKFLQEEAAKRRQHVKILILGAGESGKSTVLKQVKNVYKIPFKELELAAIKQTIQFNAVQSMNVLLKALVDLEIAVDSKTAKLVGAYTQDNTELTPSGAALIAKLWTRKPVQEAWSRRDQFWYLDAASYYFQHVERLGEPDYEPTEEDIVMARVRTTGISVTEFTEGGIDYSIVDVGGQRNERKKWIHCFDDVKAVLFVVSLIGFNQVMFEDPETLRLTEALSLFEQVVANPAFIDSTVILALNKKDLFEDMLRSAPLSRCFPDFKETEQKGLAHNELLQSAIQFIQKKFEDAYHSKSSTPAERRAITTHVVAARFKKDIKYMVEDIHLFVGEHRPGSPRMSAAAAAKAAQAAPELASARSSTSKSRRRKEKAKK